LATTKPLPPVGLRRIADDEAPYVPSATVHALLCMRRKDLFSAGSHTDSATQYGKMVFAHKVVRANADTINSSGFNALPSDIRDVIDAHGKGHP
jgi:hypothetical protein